MGWDNWNPVGAAKNFISDAGDRTSGIFNAAKDKTKDAAAGAAANTAREVENIRDFSVSAFKLRGAMTRVGLEKTVDFAAGAGAESVSAFGGAKKSLFGIDFTPGASNPPAAQGLEFSETKGASNLAYDAKLGEVYKFPDGRQWEVVDVMDRQKFFQSGFRAVALKSGDEVIVAFAGTNPKSPGDILNDLAQGAGFAPTQYKQAVAFADKWKNKAGAGNVHLTGHSLGGALAAYASIKTDLKATTINSAPLALSNIGGNPFRGDVRNNPNITHYYVPGEVLTALDNNNLLDMRPGSKIAVEGGAPLYDPRAPITNHLLGNVAPQIGMPELIR